MSTTLAIGMTAYLVKAEKPKQGYGRPAIIPLKAGASGALCQVSLAKIPRNATITNAFIRWHTNTGAGGTYTMRAYRTNGAWPAQVVWSKRPAVVQAGTKALTNPAAGAAFDIPVTSTIQQMVAGTLRNYGWYIDHSGSAILKTRGSAATSRRPVLYVTYTVPPPTPTGLEPSDASVSTDKPPLIFNADPAITALRVQVDPAANGTTPAFDSGTVSVTGGLLDLADTAYAGLDDGSSTYWRVQQRTSGGWSAWSPWVGFMHEGQSPLTITSPTGVGTPLPINDGTPPITWTFGGIQVAWRVRLLAADGDVIADSLRKAGTDTDWTPPKGLTVNGQQGRIEVTVWDDLNRAATPGNPAETIQTLEVVLTPDTSIPGYTGTSASNQGMEPTVTVSGTRASIPDFVALVRDGVEVGRWVGTDVTVPEGGGFRSTVFDYTARMNRPAVYALVPVVNDKKGATGATVLHTPRCKGIWLAAVETGDVVVLWGNDDAEQDQPEMSIVHRPIIDADEVPVVRRRLLRGAPEGSISGIIADVPGYPADVIEARLRAWAEDGDAGDLFSLALGGYTGRVCIGNVVFSEVNTNPGDGRVVNVSLDWWQQ